MPFAETVVKGPVGSLMNRWSSHRIVRECSVHRCKGFRRVSEVNLVLEGALRRTAHGAGSESRRSAYELELRRRRGPRRRHRRQPYPLQIGPDRGRIGQGGDDPQAPATGRACAEVGGKHPRQQGRPPQAMGAGTERSKRGPPPSTRQPAWAGTMRPRSRARGARTPVVAQEMEPGRGDQSRQLLQQFHRREQEMAGPIRPRCFERESKAVAKRGGAGAPRPGPAWPRSGTSVRVLAGQGPSQARPERSRDESSHRKAARSEAQGRRTHPGDRIFQDPSQALTGAGPGSDEPSHRSHGESRQPGSSRRADVEQPAFPAQADDAAHSSPRSAAPLGPIVEQAAFRAQADDAAASTICCTAWSDNGGAAPGASSPST